VEQSRALHEAVARYKVYISRRIPKVMKVEVASDLTNAEAVALQRSVSEQLAAEEPGLAGCMCRSIASRELTNAAEVARILGYGPGFCYDRAVEAVEAFRRAQSGDAVAP
jgi:hypothetical protein